jgi:hypothetical protein
MFIGIGDVVAARPTPAARCRPLIRAFVSGKRQQRSRALECAGWQPHDLVSPQNTIMSGIAKQLR